MLHRYLYFAPDDDASGAAGASDDDATDDAADDAVDDPGGQDDSQDQAPTKAQMAKANREAAKFRRQARELQAKVEELEGDAKTELQRAMDKATAEENKAKDLESQLNIMRVRILGEEVGIVKEARRDAAQLLDWSAIQDPSDDEEVTKALKDLVEDRPYLLGNTGEGADGGAGSDRRADSGDMNRLLRAAAGR